MSHTSSVATVSREQRPDRSTVTCPGCGAEFRFDEASRVPVWESAVVFTLALVTVLRDPLSAVNILLLPRASASCACTGCAEILEYCPTSACRTWTIVDTSGFCQKTTCRGCGKPYLAV